MSDRSAKETDNLIRDKLPGYKLSPESTKAGGGTPLPDADAPARPRPRRRVDATTPSIDDLRRKFLRSDAGDAATDEDEDEAQDADIVLVEPEVDTGGRRQRKAVVISASGKVLGAQG